MTKHLTLNQDATSVTPSDAASGPLVGFFDSWAAGVDAQMRTSAQYGIEYFMQDLDWQQTQSLLEAGVDAPPQLMLSLEDAQPGEGNFSVGQMMRDDSGYYEDFIPERSEPYINVARHYAGEGVDDDAFHTRLQAYDARIAELKERHPELSLMSSEDMFSRVRKDAVAAEHRRENDRRTWGGAAGGFFGEALASLHPGTDPLNFYTLGVGGVGKTAAQRILGQVGMQGAVETINQVTGVQEERRLLGLSHGFADAAGRVGSTALGAGVLQGVGEVAGYGLRRWFGNDTKLDPRPEAIVPDRPEAPVLTRQNAVEEGQVSGLINREIAPPDIRVEPGRIDGSASAPSFARTIADADAALQSWEVAYPVEVAPRAVHAPDTPATSTASRDLARYEKVSERATAARGVLETAEGVDPEIGEAMDAVSARIADLYSRLRGADTASRHGFKKQVETVKADRDGLLNASAAREPADVTAARKEIAKAEDKMQDIAPEIARERAQEAGAWDASSEDISNVWRSFGEGQLTPNRASPAPVERQSVSLRDRVALRLDAEGATLADQLTNTIAHEREVNGAALDAFRAEASRLVTAKDESTVMITGSDHEFSLDADTINVPNEDGDGFKSVSIRELLDQNQRAEQELEAVTSCSIK